MAFPYQLGYPDLAPDPFLRPAPAPLPQQAQPPALPTFEPDDEQSLLLRLGHKALAGLGFLGASLDKAFGARAIRGLLGGHPREALSLIPFSDTLGITSPEDTVYGRELLEKAGVVGPNSPGFDPSDLLGFAADIALDPATYISPFALTKAGAALGKRGGLKGMTWGEQVRGPQYLESQVARLEPARAGLATPAELVPRDANLLPVALQKEAEKEIGERLVPQFRRVAERAQPETLPPIMLAPGQPSTPIPLAPGMVNPVKTYEQALEEIGQGRLPPPGKYLGAVEPEQYKQLTSTAGLVGDDALEAGVRKLADKATGAATPLRGLLGIGLPFAEPSVVLGTGETAAKILDKVGAAGRWLKGTAPVRYGRALLDNTVDRAVTAPVQELSSTVKRPLEEELTAGLGRDVFDLKRELEPLLAKGDPAEINRLLTRAAEGVPIPQTLAEYKADLLSRDPVTHARLLNDGTLDALDRQFARIGEIGGRIGEMNRGYLAGEQALGIPTQQLSEGDYLMRLLNPLPEKGGGILSRIFGQARQAVGGSHTSQLARKDLWEHFPEGTSQINEMLKLVDEVTGRPMLVSGQRLLNNQGAEAFIREQLTRTPGVFGSGSQSPTHLINEAEQAITAQNLFRSKAEAQAWLTAQGITDPRAVAAAMQKGEQGELLLGKATAAQERINLQAKDLAEHLRGVDPRFATEQLNFFREDPLLSAAVRGQKSVKARASAEAGYEGLKDIAKPMGSFAPGQSIPVPKILEAANLNLKDPAGQVVSHELAAKALGLKDVQALENYHVPADVGNDMVKWLRAWTTPEEVAPVLQAFDKATNMMKAWLTVPFPGFHFRNVMSGVFNMWRDNALSPAAMSDAKSVLLGRPIEALPGMKAKNPEEVLNQVLKEVYSQRVAFTSGARSGGDLLRTKPGALAEDIANVPGRLVKPPEELAAALGEAAAAGGPGQQVSRFLSEHGQNAPDVLDLVRRATGVQDLRTLKLPPEALGDVLGTTTAQAVGGKLKELGQNLDLNPFHIAGVSELGETNTVIKAGRAVSNTAEDWMRVSHYIAKRRQGFSPTEAADAVRKYHFDYGDVTPFERSVMKRFIPFYTFSSKNLPPILEDLATRPAKLAASVRGATLAGEEKDMFVPPYIGEGANVGIPGAPEGSARFISSFGMPFEDEFVRALGSLGALDLKRATGEVLGGMNAIFKYPIEEATGRQLHTGRELRDLRPNWAGTAGGLLDEDSGAAHFFTQLLANSPAARGVSTVEKLIDERKDVPAKLVNLLTGARITDVDLGKQQEIAARATLQDVLKQNNAFKTFEDVYVKPEKLPNLTPEELATYALYKQIQKRNEKESQAKKRIGLPMP